MITRNQITKKINQLSNDMGKRKKKEEEVIHVKQVDFKEESVPQKNMSARKSFMDLLRERRSGKNGKG